MDADLHGHGVRELFLRVVLILWPRVDGQGEEEEDDCRGGAEGSLFSVADDNRTRGAGVELRPSVDR